MKKNNYLVFLFTFIVCFFGVDVLRANADTGTVGYTYHYMVKGMQDLGTNVKHKTTATLYNPSGYITCSNTYLQNAGYPSPVCGSPLAYSYVDQIKTNMNSQAHYHVSSAYPYARFQTLSIDELISLNK